MARTTEQDKVRELQRTLYRAAKADPGRRFHALYDKVYRRDVLERAWELVRANRGAAGIDRQTIADVEEFGVTRLLDELAADLRRDGGVRFRPAGCSSRSPAGQRSEGRSRFLRFATVLCRRPRRSSLSRSSRPTCSSARLGFVPDARRTTPSKFSLMRPGRAGGGSLSRTSPTVLRRSRTRG